MGLFSLEVVVKNLLGFTNVERSVNKFIENSENQGMNRRKFLQTSATIATIATLAKEGQAATKNNTEGALYDIILGSYSSANNARRGKKEWKGNIKYDINKTIKVQKDKSTGKYHLKLDLSQGAGGGNRIGSMSTGAGGTGRVPRLRAACG